jgi:hypothetical protein
MGSPILGFNVYILTSDGVTFGQSYTFCNGGSASVISTRSCSIPVATLRSSPFNLPWGTTVKATVVAYNSYGDSVNSTIGFGSGSTPIIVTVPDAPINLAENIGTRGAT